MPLDKLRTYEGRNPCPPDIDVFWDESLVEMRALDPEVELAPARFEAPRAECFDLYFTGVGGARVHAKFLRPREAPVGRGHPALLQFHGYGVSSGDWLEKLAWVGQGFCVAALDCRGQNGLSEDTGGIKGPTHSGHIIRGLRDESPTKLLYRSIFLDAAQLARIVMGLPEVDDARVGATGASQGGGLTLACAALEPRVCRAAPVLPFLCDYKRVWEMDQAKDAYLELKTYFKHFDPRHEREEAIFTRLGYIDCQHLARRIRARVLMGVGLMDSICPPSTQFAAFNRITSPKDVLVYPDFGHETLPEMGDRIFRFMLGM